MSNTARIIEDLISLEAWHDPLEYDCDAPLHVALSFSDARYSGGDENPIEFQVQIKRAVLVVVCDENLTIPKKGRLRHHPDRETTIKELTGSETQESKGSEESLSAKGKVDAKGPVADVTGNLKGTALEQEKEQVAREVSETLSQKVEMTYRATSGEHQWECKPILGDYLDGRAHDGNGHLLNMRPKLGTRIEDLGVRVFVRCKADDIVISDIEVKKSWLERLQGKEDLDRRLQLAREVIKLKLAEAQLEIVELEPKFQNVVLADIVALPE